MSEFRRITQDPTVMGGKPCIRGQRVTVGMIVGQIGADRSIDALLADYPTDSDEVAQAYRYEVARGFRDDVAHLSDLISPSGEAFWPAGSLASVKPRGQSGIATSTFFLLLRLLWACGQRDCVVQAQRHVHGAQVFRADCRVRRRLSPVRSSRWALWTRRSSTASA